MDFDRLATEHKDVVYRQMLRVCGNHDDAEDVLAESLAKAYRALDGLKDEDSFRAWLVQIGRRTCGRLKKRESAHPLLELSEVQEAAATSDVLDEVMERETKRCVMEAFALLPEHYQDVYRMKDLEGRSLEEIGEELDLSLPNVKSRLHRARAMLRENLDCAL